ncbi:hypothetical protein JTE90_011097 [Oedothorax gibbosus]|uniref:Integrase catalytic domain-containing protein n=1 Tax=Oedothorax gibbosus TaxID=931172 RepID=A0AAV6TFH5_9ARAC|nr:hypothetical protein JTE90_011097 [Oedothorax gibbosus]
MFGYMFLVIVDAHSKWLEVYPMKSTTTFKTIESLRDCFARFGLPVTLVSNGPQFTSHEFKTFMNSNGIKHKTTAPFKPLDTIKQWTGRTLRVHSQASS